MADLNLTLLYNDTPLEYLNKIVKKSTTDITFEDLTYSVSEITFKKNFKQILNSISGEFCYGELTAILGPSGAGKTTLLNVLAGYVNKDLQGNIKLNKRSRNLSTFKKISSYIMQENIVQSQLTVKEAMTYAARFKLGSTIKDQDKTGVVEELIKFLGLKNCENTRSEYLSGGEKKRLTIAVELVDNPSVIFLDEPTTGLDDYAVKQTIDLLKKISQLNRTVICTIHRPSSLIFYSFDQVYVMADGYCVYNGAPTHLVSFLNVTNYSCPSNYNPADHIIEVVSSEPSAIDSLQNVIQNGKINMREDKERVLGVIHENDKHFKVSFTHQLYLLLSRMIFNTIRNKFGLFMQLCSHLICGVTLGGIYFGAGNDASQGYKVMLMCFSINVAFTFLYSIIPVLNLPFEIALLKREYFNRWYRLKVYCVAMTLINLTRLLIFGIIFVLVTYTLSDLPMEWHHFVGFSLMCLIIGLTSHAMGFLMGAIFDGALGVMMNMVVLVVLLVLGVYGLGYKLEFTPFIQFLTAISYIRHGSLGMGRALAYKRKPLDCEEVFCYYVHLDKAFELSGLEVYHFIYDFGYVCIFFLIFQISCYFVLKYRLNNYHFAGKIGRIVKRIIKN